MHHLFLDTIKNSQSAVVKIADRLHNMRTLDFMKKDRQKVKADETIKMYLPLARELGAFQIAEELKELSLKYLTKNEYSISLEHLLQPQLTKWLFGNCSVKPCFRHIILTLVYEFL